MAVTQRTRRAARLSASVAMGAVVALVATACATGGGSEGSGGESGGGGEGGALKIGTLLPQTGALAFLGPPEIAGVDLAMKEINEAGGINGEDVEIIHRDSGDTTTNLATQSTTDLLNQDVSAVVGPASSGVAKTVINQITGAGVIQFSPANTSPDFTDWDDDGFYWRTAPSDVLQGQVLGNFMVSQGASNIGMIVLNDAYGTGLAANIRETVEAAGGTIAVESMFNEGDSQFTSQVDEVVGADPDAIAVITFDQAKSIVPLLTSKGISADQLYFVDGNIADYSADFDPGTLEGAYGTQPGSFAQDDFKERLAEVDDSLTVWNYAGESYDATVMLALAAAQAGSTDPAAIRDELQAVSRDGEKCTEVAQCLELIEAGTDIDYDGISGPVTMSENGDVTEATMGIYKFDGENRPQPDMEEQGSLE